MLSLMSTQPLFLLGSGRFTHLENGCFNQSASDGEQRESEAAKLGSAGQAFIEKELPLFNIPWAVKVRSPFVLIINKLCSLYLTSHP